MKLCDSQAQVWTVIKQKVVFVCLLRFGSCLDFVQSEFGPCLAGVSSLFGINLALVLYVFDP